MTSAISLPIVGGFYRTRNRFERPEHSYPAWEFLPRHFVTDDRIAWHKQNLPIYDPVRYGKSGNLTATLTDISYPVHGSVEPIVGGDRYSDSNILTKQTLTELVMPPVLNMVPISNVSRYDDAAPRTEQLTQVEYLSIGGLEPTFGYRYADEGVLTQELTEVNYSPVMDVTPITNPKRYSKSNTSISDFSLTLIDYSDLSLENTIPQGV